MGPPLIMGVSYTSQVFPLSGVWYTLELLPPVAIQAWVSYTITFELLAAKATSPFSAGGTTSQESLVQLFPPSRVMIMAKQPSIGSPIAMPSWSFQNFMES